MAAADLLAPGGADARTRGLLFHEWFQKVGFLDQPDGVPNDSALRACARRQAPELPDGELSTWIAEFREALRVPEIRKVLEQDGAKDLWTERAFALRVDGQLLQGRFDRVAIWDDRALVVDFKTDAAGSTDQERYRPQVECYRQAVSCLIDIPAAAVDTRLVFIAGRDVISL